MLLDTLILPPQNGRMEQELVLQHYLSASSSSPLLCWSVLCPQTWNLLKWGEKRGEKNTHGTYLTRAQSSKSTQIDPSREKLPVQTYRNPLRGQEEAQIHIFCGPGKVWERLFPALMGFGALSKVPNDGKCFSCGTQSKPRRPRGLFHQPQSTWPGVPSLGKDESFEKPEIT